MATLLFLSLIPIVTFAVVEHYKGMKSAIYTGIFSSLTTAVLIYILLGEVDYEILTMIFLFFLLGYISLRKEQEIYYKLGPAITGLISTLFLLWYQLFDQNFFLKMTFKLQSQLSPEQQQVLMNPEFVTVIERVTWDTILFTIIHSAIIAYAAFNWKTKSWALLKVMQLPLLLITILGIELFRR